MNPTTRLSTAMRLGWGTTGLLVLSALCALTAPPQEARSAAGEMTASTPGIKNVVVILADTLRASHLKCYGHYRDTSPNIDKLGAEGVLFEMAFSVSPWTRTSVVSLFTGLHPCAHGVQDRNDGASDELVTMAELFKARGFATGAFVTNVNATKPFNVQQGFDHAVFFDRKEFFAANPGRKDPGYVPIEGMMPETFKWLDAVGGKPFFLYFHCTDPHYNYLPPPPYDIWSREKESARRAAQNLPPLKPDEWIEGNPLDRYDGAIRYTDEYVGLLFEYFRTRGMLDDTLFVFTADHGEEWADHGAMGHGHTLYDEMLHVPLIFRHPSLSPARRSETVRLIDVLPTMIELCGLDAGAAPRIQGRSLVPMLNGKPDPKPEEQFVFAEVDYPSKIVGVALELDGWKIIHTKSSQPIKAQAVAKGKKDAWELYYMRQSRAERVNLAQIATSELARMKAALDRMKSKYGADAVAPVQQSIDSQLDDALRTLGYAGDDNEGRKDK